MLSLGGDRRFLAKNKSPASRITMGILSNFKSLIIVAFRARPPNGFLGQPQGSVSPQTFDELIIENSIGVL